MSKLRFRLANPETVRAQIASGRTNDQAGGKYGRKAIKRRARKIARWVDR